MELQTFDVIGSVLLICVGYVDLGKWAAAIEGGVHVGLDFLLPLVVFNWIGIFLHYITTRISLVTNKSLAQVFLTPDNAFISCFVCRFDRDNDEFGENVTQNYGFLYVKASLFPVCLMPLLPEEYSNFTCVTLGVIVLISMITSQLSMILGVAYGLNLTLEISPAGCMFFSLSVVSVFPFLSLFLETSKLKEACIRISGFTLFLYVFGTLISQQENPLPRHDNPSGLNGEAAYAIMALLGANVMPHNMYIQSLLSQGRTPHDNINSLISGQFFTMLFAFTGIFLVNYALGSSAAAVVFNKLGLLIPNFRDTSLLMDQVFFFSSFILSIHFTNSFSLCFDCSQENALYFKFS
ncbi:putative NRAMP family protein [Dioscorea sansibarensis]